MTTHQKQIGDQIVFVRKFEPFVSLRKVGNLQKSFLTPLVAAWSASAQKDEAAQDKAMVEAVQRMSNSLSGEQLEALAKDLINENYVSVRAAGSDQDDIKRLTEGELNQRFGVEHLIDIIYFVVETNWAGFSKRVLTLITEARAKAMEKAGALGSANSGMTSRPNP